MPKTNKVEIINLLFIFPIIKYILKDIKKSSIKKSLINLDK
jgi:hypothetical protein